MIDKREFWSIIHEAKQKGKIEYITDYLTGRSEEEIVQFELQFREQMEKSYTSSLWGAAFIIMGGCSDDCFDYFRGWLIAQGEEVFNLTLENPEYMARYIPEEYRDEEIMPQLEEILNVADEVFTYKRTGSWDYDEKSQEDFHTLLEGLGYKFKLIELEFDWEDEDDLEKMFPELWERFGDEPLEC